MNSFRDIRTVLVAVVIASAFLLIYTPVTVHAAGVTRGPKNNTETTRSALCYDNSNPVNKSISKFGAVWINDTPTGDATNARWDETMTVAWNATNVSATMWTTAYNCPASEGGRAISNAKIIKLTPATGGSVPITFNSGNQILRGTGTTNPGQYTNPPGALRVSLNVTGKATGCYSVRYSGQYSDNWGTGLFSTYSTQVCITRQPVPSATLDGYKIDDSKVGPAGGALGAAYNFQTVAVSGAGSDTANPFFFTGAAGGGNVIPVGASGVTAHTVSVALPAPVSGYKLIGYSICYTGQSNCTSAGLAYKATSYYKALPSGTNSFTFSFTAGRAYHMRWIFQSTIGINCGTFTTTPQTLDGQTRFSAEATVLFDSVYVPSAPTVSLSFSPAVNFNGNPTSVAPVITAAGGSSTATATYGTNALKLGPTLATGVYTATWTYDDATLAVPKVCTDTFEVTNQPYLHVYGGDTMAGNAVVGDSNSSFQDCVQNSDAGIFSWNNHNTDFSGAGAQYAVLALDQILDFSSASEIPAGTNGTPTGLSLANAGRPVSEVDTAQGLFGGHFGGVMGSCDFTSDITTPANTTADDNIGGRTVAINNSDIHYVIGHDVYINGNILYAGTGGWAGVDQIPYFKVVVIGGNIYVDKGVTELDGVYVAEQDENGAGGKIFTCATGIRAEVDPLSAGYYNTCKNKLNIYGAFAAQQIQFLRTLGTVGAASADTYAANNAAEAFIYSPEVWLPRNTSTAVGSKYDAITGLPPNL